MKFDLKFKIDENLPYEGVEFLRSLGYDAVSVEEQSLDGQPDGTIAEICKIERRIIVTQDMDFSNIKNYPPSDYSGIIVFRLGKQGFTPIMQAFQRFSKMLALYPTEKRLWIIRERNIRIREG